MGLDRAYSIPFATLRLCSLLDHSSAVMLFNCRGCCSACPQDSCAAKRASLTTSLLPPSDRPPPNEKENSTQGTGTDLNKFRIRTSERLLYPLRIMTSREPAAFMDSLCRPCRRMLGLGHQQERATWRNKAYINFKSWSDNALDGSCHLCTLLFHSAAGRHYRQFIDSYSTAATYELAGIGLGNPSIRNIIDTNEGNYKYLASVEKIHPDSHRSKIACIST